MQTVYYRQESNGFRYLLEDGSGFYILERGDDSSGQGGSGGPGAHDGKKKPKHGERKSAIGPGDFAIEPTDEFDAAHLATLPPPPPRDVVLEDQVRMQPLDYGAIEIAMEAAANAMDQARQSRVDAHGAAAEQWHQQALQRQSIAARDAMLVAIVNAALAA